MADVTLTIDADAYEQMIRDRQADFAVVEPHVHGAVKAAVLRIHAWALYLQQQTDAQNGIARPLDGDPKPEPHP